MRLRRPLLLAAVFSAIAFAVVPNARATRFADQPCPESGPGAVRICPDGVVGQSYAIKLAGDAGCGPALPYQYRVLNGTLPPGVSLSQDGELSGVPTSAGNWDFWVELSDQDPPSASWCIPKKSQREFLIRVGIPAATIGTPYSFKLGAGVVGAQAWSIVSGVLPRGLTLDPVAGIIAGTPEAAGSFALTFSVLENGGKSATLDFTLTVYPELVFATVRLEPARIGQRFHSRVRTIGAVGAVRFRVLSGHFPIGVRLDGNAGVIRGQPRKRGVFRFTIQAQDSLGRLVQRPFQLAVR